MQILDDRVKMGLKLFISFAAVTLLALLIFTASRETIIALSEIKPLCIIFALVLWGVYLIYDAYRISLLIHRITGKWSNLKAGIEVIIAEAFLVAVAPLQKVELPLQLIISKEMGYNGLKEQFLLLRAIFYTIMMIIILPFILPMLTRESNAPTFWILTRYSGIIYTFIILIIAFIIIKPGVIKRLIYKITLRRGKRIKASRWIYRIYPLFLYRALLIKRIRRTSYFFKDCGSIYLLFTKSWSNQCIGRGICDTFFTYCFKVFIRSLYNSKEVLYLLSDRNYRRSCYP